jgi:hypothetical protein
MFSHHKISGFHEKDLTDLVFKPLPVFAGAPFQTEIALDENLPHSKNLSPCSGLQKFAQRGQTLSWFRESLEITSSAN